MLLVKSFLIIYPKGQYQATFHTPTSEIISLMNMGLVFTFLCLFFFFQTFSNIRLGCRSISTLTNQFRTAYSSSLSSASNTYFTIILIFGAARTNLKSYKRVMMPARYTVWLLQIFFISWRTPYTSA